MRDGLGLAGAEKVEGPTDFGVGGSEASGGEEGGVDLAGFAGGEKGAGGGGGESAEEGEAAGGGRGGGDEEWGKRATAYFPKKVGG